MAADVAAAVLDDHAPVTLDSWSCVATAPGAVGGIDALSPGSADGGIDLVWLPLAVPGTAAAALQASGRWSLGQRHDFDAEDWWFRCTFARPGDGPWDLHLDGLATLADVWVNGTHVLTSTNMFRAHVVDVDALLADENEVVVRCAALAPQLAGKRRPRPRWKARLPSDQGLRWFRTTLFGRSPAWTPDVAPVGPWRPVTLRRRPAIAVVERRITTQHDGTDGTVDATFLVRTDAAGAVTADLVVAGQRARLDARADGAETVLTGRLALPGAAAWWPATHGAPTRHDAHLEVVVDGEVTIVALAPIGLRSITLDRSDAPTLTCNGVDVFVRGACWAPLDPVTLGSAPAALRLALEQFRDAGLNLVRIQGSHVPETEAFHDLCDELGILVWQDLMFAVLDYPADDDGFVAEVVAEVGDLLDRLSAHPSTAVVCGGSEVFQQAAMLGRWTPGHEPLFDTLLPGLVADRLPGTPYWPSSPTWTGAAFSVDSGIAHYFGVGGYLRPLADARTSGVRFASECLAFSNVPGDETVRGLRAAGTVVGDGGWTAGVPRDAGRAWDFEDVRDHYVRERFGIDPGPVRAVDADHYLDLGRAAVAEVLARTFAEWRRADSPTQGAIVLQACDLVDGAGFGLVDVHARPKSGWFALARTLQPVAMTFTDEGVNGLDLHLHNDGSGPRAGTVRIRAFAGPHAVADGRVEVTVAPRSSLRLRADGVLGGFYDLTYAYRFGPRSIDAVAATWSLDDDAALATVFFADGQPLTRTDVGLAAELRPVDAATSHLVVTTASPARCVLVDAPGATCSDDAFDLEPGREAVVVLRHPGVERVRAEVRCVNGRFPVAARAAEPEGTPSDG